SLVRSATVAPGMTLAPRMLALAPKRAYTRNLRAYALIRALTSPPVTAPCACGRLRRATRALTQLYDDAMAPSGLRVTQFSVLRALERDGPARISDLAARTLLDRTA